jgi:signal recognition particle subunit SEC65
MPWASRRFLGLEAALGRVYPKTGAVTAPVADLVKELARRLGVRYTLIPATHPTLPRAHNFGAPLSRQ